MVINFWILGQFLTLISYIIFWISRFIKNKNNILLFDNISRIVGIISFACLGTYDGIKYTIFTILRNIMGQLTNEKMKNYKNITFLIMFAILVLINIFEFNGMATICILICGTLNLYAVIMCDEQGIRKLGMLGSVFYNLFMFITGNIAGVVCETICFCVMLASYIKYKNINKIEVKSN